MKRKSGFFDKLTTEENIKLADTNARKSKKRSIKYIQKHDAREDDNEKLLQSFKDLTYKTSPYTKFKIYEPKEREIFKLPYYPDRIGQHAIMNVVKEYWTSLFIENTYSCIEGRGIHKCLKDLKRDLRKTRNDGRTKYCLKIDIVKFYPSIVHPILKEILRHKIKDKKFLAILDEVIDSINGFNNTPGIGVPIGNYLSQFFANLYLTEFDHWCKEVLKCRFYYRYADDIVILGDNKEWLAWVLTQIEEYLGTNLQLKVKHTHQIFPVESRGIDFVGYIFRHNYVLIRKSIKTKVNTLLLKYERNEISIEDLRKSLASYYGWLKYANSKHFLHIIEERCGLKFSNFVGIESGIRRFKDRNVNIINVTEHLKYYVIEFVYAGRGFLVKSTNKTILPEVKKCPNNYIL